MIMMKMIMMKMILMKMILLVDGENFKLEILSWLFFCTVNFLK
jgi:hypothetical protein